MATATEMTKSTAAAKVFSTFEILESILLNVLTGGSLSGFNQHLENIKVIYRSQRVSTTFRDVISRSKPLRVGMFQDYRSDGGEKNTWIADDLHEKAATRFSSELLATVLDKPPSIIYIGWHCYEYPRGVMQYNFEIDANSVIDESSFTTASWRHMLVVGNKKIGRVNIGLTMDWCHTTRRKYDVELGGGATLGELVDKIVKAVQKAEKAGQSKTSRLR